MRKFKKEKKEHGRLWERGATQDVREKATSDFQIQYIVNNVFYRSETGPRG